VAPLLTEEEDGRGETQGDFECLTKEELGEGPHPGLIKESQHL